VVQNYSEAVKWFRLAAAQGDADAQYNLGYLKDLQNSENRSN
jgi:TPR repeat protein